MNIMDKIIKKSIEKDSVLVVGLDPDIKNFPKILFSDAGINIQDLQNLERTEFLEKIETLLFNFNKIVIDACFENIVAIKPQLACYEIYGSYGIRALEKTIKYAKEKNLIVINDAKRGDIGNTSNFYAEAFLGNSTLSGDLVTVNPYMGEDAYRPYFKYFDKGKGVFILTKTSNPSSSDIQDLLTKEGEEIYRILAKKIAFLSKDYLGEFNYSSIGVVVGATFPEIALALRKIMINNVFLVPGYGAQGGEAKNLKVLFDKNGHGALIVSARGIIFSYKKCENWENISINEISSFIKNAAVSSKNELNLVRK